MSTKAAAIAVAARTVSEDDALASAVRLSAVAARPSLATPAVVFPTSSGPIVTGPVTAPGLPADAPAPHNVDRIVQTIRLAWARGVGDAQIRLEPGRFGDLTVSLRVEHGQVIARLQSDVPAVREWLQANQATFRQGLADHHLDLNRLEVVAARTSVDDPAGREERRREPSDQPPARRPRRPHTGEMFDIVA
jgi:flagellar hook-length control protein FliK